MELNEFMQKFCALDTEPLKIMNREIKFKGKRTDSKLWITGGYIECSDIKGNKQYQIVSSVGYHNDVIPETVGQFIGLYDKDGTEIYEGDILKAGNIKYSCDFHSGKFILKHGAKSYPISSCDLIEVCGNIHDNPELINNE